MEMGVGDQTIAQVCEAHNVHTPTFSLTSIIWNKRQKIEPHQKCIAKKSFKYLHICKLFSTFAANYECVWRQMDVYELR